MIKPICVFALLLSLAIAMSGSLEAQCYGSLMLSSTYFEFDYLARLAVHFGDAASIPSDIVCSRSMLPSELLIDVPIWAYNLHEGADYFEFSVHSNESLAVFIPDNCISVIGSSRCQYGTNYCIDLALQACQPKCGPVRLGLARIVRVRDRDPVWIDLKQNGQTGKMFEIDTYGRSHDMYSPQHGGFVGQDYLYTCQEPICEEPNLPVADLVAEKGPACSVKLMWIAGSGNRTMIRLRTDRYPTGYEDGELAVEVPSTLGQSQFFYHTNIESPSMIYYKAFSLTRDASDLVMRSSFVECGSVDTVKVHCEIAAQPVSWGAIKSLFR